MSRDGAVRSRAVTFPLVGGLGRLVVSGLVGESVDFDLSNCALRASVGERVWGAVLPLVRLSDLVLYTLETSKYFHGILADPDVSRLSTF